MGIGLARALGITPQAISNYKKRNQIPLKLVVQFADIYRVFIDWLLTGQGPIYKTNSEDELSSEEIIYLGKLLKILRGREEYKIVAMKHTIDAFFQFSELTKEINEILDKEKHTDESASKIDTGAV